MSYPFLSLSHLSIDPALARQLPRKLAYYYLAIPVAEDGERLSVVMENPENRAAVRILQLALGRTIVPVRGNVSEIKATLHLLWPQEAATEPCILSWSASTQRAALAESAASLVAKAFSAHVISLDSGQSSLETILAVAHEDQYSLVVLDLPQGQIPPRVIRSLSKPVLLVRGDELALRHILLVLRGHSPDEQALDWVIPLAKMGHGLVTLLAVAPPVPNLYTRETRMLQGLAALLYPAHHLGRHILECVERLNEAGIEGYLKLRQGPPERQIAEEVSQGEYDLIAIAAEATGEFVQRVLEEVGNQSPQPGHPVLIVKAVAG
jgi:nucleotide-binding universal stress UspA family protein